MTTPPASSLPLPEPPKPPILKRNWPILTFFSRAWLLTLFTVLLNCVPLWSHAWFYLPMGNDEWGNMVWRGVTTFELVGSVSYIPGVVLAALWVMSLGIHLYFRDTLDADAHSGQYVKDWQALDARDRVFFSVILRTGVFIGTALIVAGIVK